MLEFVKDNKKFIYIIIFSIVLFVVATHLINSCSRLIIDGSMSNVEIDSIKKLSMQDEKEAEEILKGIAIKNEEWSTYPLSKDFLDKYSSKDGIFPQYDFEEVSGHRLDEDIYPERYTDVAKYQGKNQLSGIFVYTIGNGLTKLWVNSVREIDVAYYINNKNELDDFVIIYDKQTVDEYGDPVRDYDKEFTEKNINLLNDILFFDHWCRFYSIYPDRPIIRKEPISSRLANKIWKDQEDVSKGFIDYFEGLDYTVGNVYWLKSKTKKEAFVNNDLYCICKLYKDGEEPYYDNEIDYEPIKNYLYKVDISFDDDKKLDDIKVRFIKEISNEECMEKYTARLVED